MNKLSQEKQMQLAAIVLGALALTGFIWYFVIGATSERLQKVKENILDVDDRVYKAELRIRQSRIVDAEFADLTQRINAAERQMIPLEQLNGKKWLLDTINRFIETNQHEVVPTRLDNQPVTGNQFLFLPNFAYSAAAYNLELRAYYHEFGRFLADFENSFPYIRIQNLQLSPIATPSAAVGPAADVPEELLTSTQREQLNISMKVIVLFKLAEAL